MTNYKSTNQNNFKDHFSQHAKSYCKARPHYPTELFSWLANAAPAGALAWDAGCGNGQASVALADHFEHVIGTDASTTQIAEAIAHPRITYRVQTAESFDGADASVDLITVAQALHWMDVQSFFANARRVLKARGVMAAWCYGLLRCKADIDAIIVDFEQAVVGSYWPPERRYIDRGYQDFDFPFQQIESPSFIMQAQWHLDALLAYIESWSAVQNFRRANSIDPMIKLRDSLTKVWGEPAGVRNVAWPLTVKIGLN